MNLSRLSRTAERPTETTTGTNMKIEIMYAETAHEAVKLAVNYAEINGREVDIASFEVDDLSDGVMVKYRTYPQETT